MGSCALCARCKATVRVSVSFSWMAHCTKVIGSIPEGDQKGHKYTCFARIALCIYNLYAPDETVILHIKVFFWNWWEESETGD